MDDDNQTEIGDNLCWVPHPSDVWCLASVSEPENGVVECEIVDLTGAEETSKFNLDEKLFDEQSTHVEEVHLHPNVSNLCQLYSSKCHEGPVLHFIRNMYSNQKQNGIYINVASNILLALNPHAARDALYENPMRFCKEPDTLNPMPPHIYNVCNSILRKLFHANLANTSAESLNHSLIMHGDSGAGKTEETKLAAAWIVSASKQINQDDADTEAGKRNTLLESVLKDANTVFESFGNAKTKCNDNSSRFGRYVKLQYTESNKLVSIYNETFGLEKSRLVSMTTGERNYHIFYQLFRGMGSAYPDLKKRLNLQAVEQFRMLTNGNCLYRQHVQEDVTGFHASVKAMVALGTSESELKALWTLLAVMLHLGNATCEQDRPGDPCAIHIDTMSFSDVADLLGVNADQFTAAITTATIIPAAPAGFNTPGGKAKGSIAVSPQSAVTTNLPKDEVMVNIHGFLKHMYKGIYFWLVRKTNHAGAYFGNLLGLPVKFIGIMDVYGFEDKHTNGLEQLMINFAEERLKQQYIERIFVNEVVTCSAEGLDTEFISFTNNAHIIDYISKRPSGILPTLDDATAAKVSSVDALYQALTDAVATSNQSLVTTPPKNSLIKTAVTSPVSVKDAALKKTFTITHFCGDTHYQLDSFLGKNIDGTSVDYMALLSSSSNLFLKATLGIGNMVTEGEVGYIPWLNNPLVMPVSINALKTKSIAALPNSTVSSMFTGQLDTMMSNLRSTASHYVKCIRPNSRVPQAERGQFNSGVVNNQLRSHGIYDSIFLTKTGYPERIDFREFYTQFEILKHSIEWPVASDCTEAQLLEYSTEIATNLLDSAGFKIGKTKMCLQDGVIDYLHNVIQDLKNANACLIQSHWRRFMCQRRFSSDIVVWRQKKATAEFAKSLFDNTGGSRSSLVRSHHVQVDIFSAINNMKEGKIRTRSASPGSQTASITNIFAPINPDDNDADSEHIKRLQEYYINKMNIIRGFLRNCIVQRRVSAIFAAVSAGDSETVMTTLKRRPELLESLDKSNEFMSLRHAAIKSGKMDMVRLLGMTPVSICQKDSGDNTSIHYAGLSPNLTLFKLFYKTLSTIIAVPKTDQFPVSTEKKAEKAEKGGVVGVLGTTEAPREVINKMGVPVPVSLTKSPLKISEEKDKYKGHEVKKCGYIMKLNNSGRLARRYVSLEKNRLKYWYTMPEKDSQDVDYFQDEFRISRGDCFFSRYSADGKGDLFFALNFSSSSTRKRRKKIIWKCSNEADLQSWLHTMSQVASFDRFRSYAPRFRNPQLCRVWLSQLTWARESVLHTMVHASNIKLRKARRAFYKENYHGVHKDADCVFAAIQCMAWLIDHGCPVNQKNIDGQTALHLAVEGGNSPVAVALVRKGANLDVKDFKAIAPIELCDKYTSDTLGYTDTAANDGKDPKDPNDEGSDLDSVTGTISPGTSSLTMGKKKVGVNAEVIAARVTEFGRVLKHELRTEFKDYHRLQMVTKDSRLLPSSLVLSIGLRNPSTTHTSLVGVQKKGLSYMSMHIQKHYVERTDFMSPDRMADIENFKSVIRSKRMCLQIGVYNGQSHQLLEPIQECEKPIFVDGDFETLWWGFNYFVQTPLEFFPIVTYIKFRLYMKDLDTREVKLKGKRASAANARQNTDEEEENEDGDEPTAGTKKMDSMPRLVDIEVSQACYLIDKAAIDSGNIRLSLRDVKGDAGSSRSSNKDKHAGDSEANVSVSSGSGLSLKTFKRGGTSQSNLDIDIALNEYFEPLHIKDVLQGKTDSTLNYVPGCYVNNPNHLQGANHDKLQNKNKRGLVKQAPVVFALSYFEGASSDRFHFTLPKYVKAGDLIKAVGGHKHIDFQVPGHAKGGQSVIMVVPRFINAAEVAELGLPQVKVDDFSPNRADVVRLLYTLPRGVHAGPFTVQNTDGSRRLLFQISEALIASLDSIEDESKSGLPIIVVFNSSIVLAARRGTEHHLEKASAGGVTNVFSKFLGSESKGDYDGIGENKNSDSEETDFSESEVGSEDDEDDNFDDEDSEEADDLYNAYAGAGTPTKVLGSNPMAAKRSGKK